MQNRALESSSYLIQEVATYSSTVSYEYATPSRCPGGIAHCYRIGQALKSFKMEEMTLSQNVYKSIIRAASSKFDERRFIDQVTVGRCKLHSALPSHRLIRNANDFPKVQWVKIKYTNMPRA